MQDLAGHVAGIRRREEDETRGDLAGFTRPAERNIFAELGDLLGREGRRNERRPDRTRRDGVDADFLLRQRFGKRTREGEIAPLVEE